MPSFILKLALSDYIAQSTQTSEVQTELDVGNIRTKPEPNTSKEGTCYFPISRNSSELRCVSNAAFFNIFFVIL